MPISREKAREKKRPFFTYLSYDACNNRTKKKKKNLRKRIIIHVIRGGPRHRLRGDRVNRSTTHPRRRSVDARTTKIEAILQRWIRRPDESKRSGVDFGDTRKRCEE